MEDRVQVRCTRCKSVFREAASRLQDGYSRQCPSCETVLFLNESSADLNIKRALRDARDIRRRIREREQEKLLAKPLNGLPRNFSGRGHNEQDQMD